MEHILYGCKDVPNIKISLMDDNEIKYTFEHNAVTHFFYQFGTDKEKMEILLQLMNPIDYAVLISKKYEKYIVESSTYWRNSQTYEDEIIESPARIFNNFKIYYTVNYSGAPIEWHLEFWNGERQ